MASAKVQMALRKIRDTISAERRGLTKSDDRELMEELIADAEGWNMAMDDEDAEAGS